MVGGFSKFLFILGLGLVWLSVTFSALIDPLIHIVYYRLTPLTQVNALMTREGSVFEYSETMQDSLTPWFNFAVALGVILVCVGLLHNFQGGNEDKTQKKITTSEFFRRNGLGAALGALAILSIVANLFAGLTLRESLPDPRLLSYLGSQSVLPGTKLVSYTHSPRGE
jgi:hypothetical protein